MMLSFVRIFVVENYLVIRGYELLSYLHTYQETGGNQFNVLIVLK